jgi:predicted nucleic acid-binding protein
LIVLDASAALELVMRTDFGAQIADRVFDPGELVCAPHLIDLEVAQVLRRYVRTGDISELRAGEALQDFLDLAVERYPHNLFLRRIWQMRDNVTAYDAAYVALAEVVDGVLLTTDSRLAGSSGHDAKIELIS